ncbi:tRNA-guanine(15) transglycosylase-like protein [Syncephalis fuscata]|nr:tRNA-guanine(15) transglycosylase-like protein [Syncephalis fuscata]
MYDCVFPTRTARFGNALTAYGPMVLRQTQYEHDFRPIEEDCDCLTCKGYTRAYLHTLVTRETVGCHLVSIHNISYQMRLMRGIRESIVAGTFPEFVRTFMRNRFGDGNTPEWIVNALKSVNVEL